MDYWTKVRKNVKSIAKHRTLSESSVDNLLTGSSIDLPNSPTLNPGSPLTTSSPSAQISSNTDPNVLGTNPEGRGRKQAPYDRSRPDIDVVDVVSDHDVEKEEKFSNKEEKLYQQKLKLKLST